MKSRNIMAYALIGGILTGLSISGANAAFWAAANGAGSCQRVCQNNNARALTSGTYKNGAPFYVCSANARGEGYRGGYNVEPSWANACIVGWGGKETFVYDYSCLCD